MAKMNTATASARIKELIDQQCGGSQQNFAETCGVRKNSVSHARFVITGHKNNPEGLFPRGFLYSYFTHVFRLLPVKPSLERLAGLFTKYAVRVQFGVYLLIEELLQHLYSVMPCYAVNIIAIQSALFLNGTDKV